MLKYDQRSWVTFWLVAKFLVPDCGSLFWHMIVVQACQAKKAGGPVRQLYAKVNDIPQEGTKNLDTVLF